MNIETPLDHQNFQTENPEKEKSEKIDKPEKEKIDREKISLLNRAYRAESERTALLADITRALGYLMDNKPDQAKDSLLTTFINGSKDNTMGIVDIITERKRQIDMEGWTPEHDLVANTPSVMAKAAAAYAISAAEEEIPQEIITAEQIWPFKNKIKTTKKDTRRRMIVSAALMLAAIELYDQEKMKSLQDTPE